MRPHFSDETFRQVQGVQETLARPSFAISEPDGSWPTAPISSLLPLSGLYLQRPPQSKARLPPQPSSVHSEQGPLRVPDKHVLRLQATNYDISIPTLQKGKPRPNTN